MMPTTLSVLNLLNFAQWMKNYYARINFRTIAKFYSCVLIFVLIDFYRISK